MSTSLAQRWIGDPAGVAKVLCDGFMPSGDYGILLADWENFYREYFGVSVDFSGVVVPAKPADGNWRLLVVAQGFTAGRFYRKCEELFRCWKYANHLDKAIDSDKEERSSASGAYAIWVRDIVEADEGLKSLSANDIAAKRVATETLAERLLHELCFFTETEKHLDVKNVTLCSGSRYRDGDVPRVHWYDGEMNVGWDGPDGRSGALRSRQAVS
jgi:hypothetical protein